MMIRVGWIRHSSNPISDEKLGGDTDVEKREVSS